MLPNYNINIIKILLMEGKIQILFLLPFSVFNE